MLSPFAHMPLVPTQEFPSMLWSAQTVTRPSSSRLTLHILSPQSGISYTPTPSDCQQPPNSHEVILLLKPSSSPGCGISPLLIWYVCVCVPLQKSCQDGTESPPMVSILRYHDTLVITKKPTLAHHYSWDPLLNVGFTRFLPMSFSGSRSQCRV